MKKILFFLLLGVVSFLFLYPFFSQKDNGIILIPIPQDEDLNTSEDPERYTSITITNDTDIIQYVAGGDGIAENPYMIDTATVASTLDFVRISNVTKYVILRDFSVASATKGISINNSQYIILRNINVRQQGEPDNTDAIELRDSVDITIDDCDIRGTTGSAIYASGSITQPNRITIQDSYIEEVGGSGHAGILMYRAYNILINNVEVNINAEGRGIDIVNTENLTVEYCTVYGNNAYNNYPGVELIEARAVGSSPLANNVTFRYNTVYAGAEDALEFVSVTNSSIYGNTVYNMGQEGIDLYGNATNNLVYDNIIYDVKEGISLTNNYNTTVYNNTIYNSTYGIILEDRDGDNGNHFQEPSNNFVSGFSPWNITIAEVSFYNMTDSQKANNVIVLINDTSLDLGNNLSESLIEYGYNITASSYSNIDNSTGYYAFINGSSSVIRGYWSWLPKNTTQYEISSGGSRNVRGNSRFQIKEQFTIQNCMQISTKGDLRSKSIKSSPIPERSEEVGAPANAMSEFSFLSF